MLAPELIEVFLAAAKYKNFSKAAETLYVSHSTVSRNITCLEEQLGTRLLLRSSRSISLTKAGELLAERAPEILAAWDELENEVRAAGNNKFNRLFVASISTYAHRLFKVYRQIQKNYPAVQLDVDQLPIQAVTEHVINGTADIGITLSFALPSELDDYIVRRVDNGVFCVVVPNDHPLAKRSSVHINELQDEARLALDRSVSGSYAPIERLNKALQTDSGLAQQKVSSIESLALRIKAGSGVVILPEHVATQFGEGCHLLYLEGIETEYELVLFARQDNANPALHNFLELLDRDNGE